MPPGGRQTEVHRLTHRQRLTACALAAVAPLACFGGAGGAVASEPAAAATGAPVITRLSDERKLSRWAYPAREAMIRTAPDDGARVIDRLKIVTEDRLPNTYLLLQRSIGPGEQDWVRLRVPGRPNGRTGWVPRDALGDFHRVSTAVTVDRRKLRVTVRRRGHVVFTAPVGIGKSSTPTPAGHFWIRENFRIANADGVALRALAVRQPVNFGLTAAGRHRLRVMTSVFAVALLPAWKTTRALTRWVPARSEDFATE
jgi:hypothetical protein